MAGGFAIGRERHGHELLIAFGVTLVVAVAVLAVGIKTGIFEDPFKGWTIGNSSGTGSGTGHPPPPPMDPCSRLNTRIDEEAEKIKSVKQMIKNRQDAGLFISANRLEQEVLPIHEKRHARMLEHYNKYCASPKSIPKP